MFEEFKPQKRFWCTEFLGMLKRLFPRGPIWNFRIGPCGPYANKVAEYPSGTSVGAAFATAWAGKIWAAGDAVGAEPGKLFTWDPTTNEYTVAADNNIGQNELHAMAPYGGKLFIGSGDSESTFDDDFSVVDPFWVDTEALTTGDFTINTTTQKLEGNSETNTKDWIQQNISGDLDVKLKLDLSTSTSAGLYVSGNGLEARISRDNAAALLIEMTGEPVYSPAVGADQMWVRFAIDESAQTIDFYWKINDGDAWTLERSYSGKDFGGSKVLYLDTCAGGEYDEISIFESHVGTLLSHTEGSGIFEQEAAQLLQQDLNTLLVWNDILYIGTGASGSLFKYDILNPGIMELVLPQLSEKEIDFLLLFEGDLYAGTSSGGHLYRWDGAGSNWESVAGPISGAWCHVYAIESHQGEIFGGASVDGKGLYKWNGEDAWINIPLPSEIADDSSFNGIHFLQSFEESLYGVTSGSPYIFRYHQGTIEILARPGDLSATTTGFSALAELNGNLYAVQFNGDTYELAETESSMSMLGKLMSVFASELSRFSSWFTSLVREAVPGLSTDSVLLRDWERIAGLPDECSERGTTQAQRQQAVHAKIYSNYPGLNADFYHSYAAQFGMTISIAYDTGGDVFRTGHKTDGSIQRVTQMPTGDIDGSRLNSTSSVYHWTVTVLTDPGGNQDILECVFNKLKPATSSLIFVKLP